MIAANDTVPLTMCRALCQLIVAAVPAGAPAGKPLPGSIRNAPAAIRPAPATATSRGTQRPPGAPESARRSPADPIRASTPQSTKLLIWIQPSVQLLRMLSGWRVMSNGRRVAAWARLTTPHSGNASAAHPSSARVDTPLASVAAGDAVPAAVVVLLPAGVLSAV